MPPRKARSRWGRSIGRLLCAVLLVQLLLGGAAAADEEASWLTRAHRHFKVGFDVVVLRPVAAVTVATGVALFIPAAALTAPGGAELGVQAWEVFVLRPGQELWERPLGDF